MKYLLDIPSEYRRTTQAMWEWMNNEYALYQLPEISRLVSRSCRNTLHDMLWWNINTSVTDMEFLEHWNSANICEEVGTVYSGPDYREQLTELYDTLSDAVQTDCPFAMIALAPKNICTEPELTRLLSPTDASGFMLSLANATATIIHSGLEYYRPIEVFDANIIYPRELVIPNSYTVEVLDRSRYIVLGAG